MEIWDFPEGKYQLQRELFYWFKASVFLVTNLDISRGGEKTDMQGLLNLDYVR